MHRKLASLRVLASVSLMVVLPAGCKDDAAAKGDLITRATIGPDATLVEPTAEERRPTLDGTR